MIIDSHVHVTENGKWLAGDYDASVERLIEEMEKNQIDKAVLLPIHPYMSNEFIDKCCREYPKRLLGFASVNPLGGVEAAEKLEKDLKRYNLKGLKLHPRLQGFAPNNPEIIPVLKKAEKLEIPIVLDCLLNRPRLLKDNLPLLVDELARAVPKAKIIMAHMGGFRFLDALAVANTNKNVYLDLSVTLLYFHNSPFEKQIEFVIKKVGVDRVIYGSDHPEKPVGETLVKTLDILDGFDLTERERRMILGENVLQLIR